MKHLTRFAFICVTILTLASCGGDGALTYSLSSSPYSPESSSFDTVTRVLSRTPTAQHETTTYTDIATKHGATNLDAASLTFTITANEQDTSLSFDDATIEDQTYIQGVAIAELTLPEATGGDGELTYSLSPELPTGLSFDAASRVLSGTPSDLQEATEYTYTVTDSDETGPDSASLTFMLTIIEPDRSPTFDVAATIADKTYINGMAITDEILPEATDGNGELTYSLGPDLPVGLSFDAATRVLSGTPSDLQEATQYTYTVTDSDETDPDSASLTFTITVIAPDASPSFGLTVIVNRTYVQDTAIENETFPEATGGDGALTYRLTPEPPTGLTFDASTRVLSGTPTAQQPATTYTYIATDSDAVNPDSVSLTFTIAVNEPDDAVPSFADGATISDKTYIIGTTIDDETLPEATGGDGAITYHLTPEPPSGLNFDAATRVLSGTPTGAEEALTYIYTATDSDAVDPDSVSLTFTITVNPPDASPSFGLTVIVDRTYVQDADIESETFPEATGGDGALTYSLSPEPPAGLTFDASTRVLSGTPTAQQTAFDYTYIATDSDAVNPDSAYLTFTISVNEAGDAVPTFNGATISNKIYVLGTTIEEETLPEATGGDGALTYYLEPEPAAGLTFDASTRVLSGTPDAIEEALVYYYTATDSDAVDPDIATLTFSIAVIESEPDADDEDDEFPDEFSFLNGMMNVNSSADEITVNVSLQNVGTIASSATTGYLEARTSWNESAGAVRAMPNEVEISALEPNGDAWIGQFTLPLSGFSSSQNYYLVLIAHRTAEELEKSREERAYGDFHIAADGQVRVTCEGFDRADSAETGDPLFEDQWALMNTGQSDHAKIERIAGEDLRMQATLADGLTGRGVTVAIVDTGMEICHPDLRVNVEDGMSFNFNANRWHGAKLDDPFLPSIAEGDHGTSVAGIVAMAANNGVGGRGVAPEAGLRGFNLLSLVPYLIFDEDGVNEYVARGIDALGMSASNPSSSDVDIFNMSYGVAPTETALVLGADKREAMRAGVEQLRISEDTEQPLGAIYVLSSGNYFQFCSSTTPNAGENQDGPPLSDLIGCVSANLDPESAWPYVIHTGAFNSNGKRASYSSVASSVWIVAPSDDVVTTDKMGLDRGYAKQGQIDELGTAEKDPLGDFTFAFSGTSAAAPFASGAIAVMLSAQPELTWRDVKHVFAKTSRQLDSDIEPVIGSFGGKTATVQHGWVTNAADYKFHNHYGFGAINLDAAVEMARSMTPNNLGTFTQSELFTQTSSTAIPDHDGEGITLSQSISGLPSNANIEAVQVRIEITHPRPYELGLTLTSPSRTPSVVNQVFNVLLLNSTDETLDWHVLSNAFYGELPNGEWQLNVIDTTAENVGQVDSWSLVFFYGEHPND